MSPASAGRALFGSFMRMLLLFSILIISMNHVFCELNKNYHMINLCKNHFLTQLYRKIDGAVLLSVNERNLDCVITFQTHSILQRFMLRFETLSLDCNDHLYIFDGAHAVSVGGPKMDLSCRNTKSAIGAVFTKTNFVTLKYVTDNWGTDQNGFKMIITAVKDPKHACKDFRCNLKEFCIHPDLLCDSVNHCSDNSDESASANCKNQSENTIFGLELTWIVLIAVSGCLVIFACLVGVAICICRRSPRNSMNNLNSNQLHQIDANGSSKHMSSTLPRETRLPDQHMNYGGKNHNGNHTIPRNFNFDNSLHTTQLDGNGATEIGSGHLNHQLMGQDLLQNTNTSSTQKDEWFV